MKRMTAKQIEVEAGRIFGAKWKNREKVGTLTEQLRAAIEAEKDLPDNKRQMAEYIIECAGDLN
ncbi:MAG: hypothetical protein HUN04_22440 [Desulfobacter sp.]|nr:MAG: hypothetical protein HUN04_22440 [Desulfobacter sp.]